MRIALLSYEDIDTYSNARCSSEAEIIRLDTISEQLGNIQQLGNAFDTILNAILHALDAPAVFMRTKGLRALGQILTADPDILRNVIFGSCLRPV